MTLLTLIQNISKKLLIKTIYQSNIKDESLT